MLKLTGLLRKKHDKEVMTYSNPAKVIDLLKREDSSKISRYQVLIRDEGPELFF